MTEEKFREVIEFAIKNEKDAAEFYASLQTKMKHEWTRKMLKELEMMELGHMEILQRFEMEGLEHYSAPKITDLKISDYMEEIIPRDDLTFQEVLITAMKREESAKNLYLDLAKKTDNETTRNLFLKLAGEEAKHKLQLETIYDEEILVEN